MPNKKKQPQSVQQTAIGNENIQVVGSHNVITRITNFFAGDTEQQRARRNRRAMLELVKNIWIKGVLEKSLYNEVLIELGMEERPGAVDHPWDVQVQMPNQVNRALPPGTSMMDVFDEMNRAMLILGEPGSGKTTMLLELARDCIGRAEQDDNQQTPVIFNLSSWDGKQSIDDWLINELNTKYNVSKKLSHSWVTEDDLHLLLDGLDEVKQENRDGCVKAINEFLQRHGLTMPIAVCSRIADYETLPTKLNLSGAMLLQPLTPEQIDAYFEQAGSELEGVHQILKNDEMLQELVKQPLILSILTLAYQGKSAGTFSDQKPETIEDYRKHLFDTYINKMFVRVARAKNQVHEPEQAKRWLSWLSQKMVERDHAIFFLDQLNQYSPFDNLQRRLRLGLIIGVGFGLFSGVLVGISTSILHWPGDDLISWMRNGLLGGMVFGVLAGLQAVRAKSHQLNRKIGWSWKKISSDVRTDLIAPMRGGVALTLVFILLMGLKYAHELGIFPNLNPADLDALAACLFFPVFFFVLVLILVVGTLPETGKVISVIETRATPDDGIKEAKHGVLFSIVSSILFGIAVQLSTGVFLLSFFWGGIMLFWGTMENGGGALLEYWQIYKTLHKRGKIPRNYIHFLDYCVDLIFLRRVGGGYIFVHRLLMEHFADMYPADEK